MFSSRRGRGGQRDTYVMFLLIQLASQIYQLEYKPLVTLALMGAQAAIHFGVIPGLDFYPWNLEQVCLIPANIVGGGFVSPQALRRLLLSTLVHASDYHLYYNLSSFLWKGHNLERRYGTVGFGLMVAIIWPLSALAEVALSVAGSMVGLDWMTSCTVGFSGVLFGLKAVLNSEATGEAQSVHGFMVTARYAVWIELVVSSLLLPHTSFLGHLGGVCAGLAYLRLQQAGLVDAVLVPLQAAIDALLIELGVAPRPGAAPQGRDGGGQGYGQDAGGGGAGWPGGGPGGLGGVFGGLFGGAGGRPGPAAGPRFYGGGVPLGTQGGGGDGVRYRPNAGTAGR